MNEYRLIYITPIGGYRLPAVSPAAAMRRDPAALRALYEELRRLIEEADRPKQGLLWQELHEAGATAWPEGELVETRLTLKELINEYN